MTEKRIERSTCAMVWQRTGRGRISDNVCAFLLQSSAENGQSGPGCFAPGQIESIQAMDFRQDSEGEMYLVFL